MAIDEHAVHLKPETFRALEAEANRRHVDRDELADELVRDTLEPTEREPGYLDDALDRLRELRKTMPKVDAAQLIRDIRDEASDRGLRWRSS